MTIVFDTNILLDVLLERDPFVKRSARLVDLVEAGQIGGSLGSTTLTTVFYIVGREYHRQRAYDATSRLLALFDIASVTRGVLEDALHLGFDDYEDAVLHEAAQEAGADGIVTRNVRDFAGA